MPVLTPDDVLSALGGLDRQTVDGWCINDVRWTHEKPQIEVEVIRNGHRVICTIDGDSNVEGGGLRLGYTHEGTTWDGSSQALLGLSQAVLAPLKNQFLSKSLAANDGKLAHAIDDEVNLWKSIEWPELGFMDRLGWNLKVCVQPGWQSTSLESSVSVPTSFEDAALLDRLRVSYRSHFKTDVTLLEGPSGRRSLLFPKGTIASPLSFARHQVPDRFITHRSLRRYFAHLGFGFDEAREMAIVPVPSALRSGLAEVNPDWPFEMRLRLARIPTGRVSWARQWLSMSMPLVVIHTGWSASAAYVHDVGLHGALLHRIPLQRWKAILGVLHEGTASQKRKTYKRAAGFIEQSLTRTCKDCWREAFEPEDFDRAFGERFDGLMETARDMMLR